MGSENNHILSANLKSEQSELATLINLSVRLLDQQLN